MKYTRFSFRRVALQPVVRLAVLLASAASVVSAQQAPTAKTPAVLAPVTVYKSATCGCCAKWNDHLRANGFVVNSTDLPDVTPTKEKYRVPTQLRSCHTALVSGYVIEGHVPADVIRKLLRERPKVVGIAVPGMPMGSPGMEGSRIDSYQVLTFDESGATTVFASR
jgi:hypothetical protein